MENVKNEVIRLHDFFVEWMTGAVDQTDEVFEQFSKSMSDDFYIVAPSGQLTQRENLIAGLYSTYNKRSNFRIWIENVVVRQSLDNVIVATYEEWQEFKDSNEVTARLSTVVFTIDERVPNQLLWRCVHETGLPSDNS